MPIHSNVQLEKVQSMTATIPTTGPRSGATSQNTASKPGASYVEATRVTPLMNPRIAGPTIRQFVNSKPIKVVLLTVRAEIRTASLR